MLARAIACMDLTSLGDDDTSETITSLCELARAPVPPTLLDALDIDRKTMVAAVCVYDRLATVALDALHNSPIRVTAVAGGFPAATASQPSRLQQIRDASTGGVHEIDAVINVALAVAEDWEALYDDVAALRMAAGDATLKVILATGLLEEPVRIWKTSMTCMMAGADFIKTSTGRENVNATLPVGVVMCDAMRRYADLTGKRVGLKPAGNIREPQDALDWVCLVERELGPDCVTPTMFRIGASGLLPQIVEQFRGWSAKL